MGTITVLRPSTTSSGVGWSAVPSGTLHGVTSDNNDATYAQWSGSGSALILGTPVDAPPAGERRHQVRVRARGEDGDAWWAVRLGSGALIAGAAGQFPASPSTITGSWGFGAPADGSTVLYVYATGQSAAVKLNELFLDVDSREAPTFTPQVMDGSGTVTTTVGDTSQPVIRADSVDLDDLTGRQYRYWVTLNGAIVWDTGVVSGPANDRQTSPLANGSYVAHLYVWSTLGANTPYPSEEETISFTVSVGAVPSPDNPTVEPEDGTPFYRLEACAPYTGGFDGDEAYIEIQRVDCPLGGYLSLSGAEGSYASTPDPGWPSGSPPAVIQVSVVAQRDDSWFVPEGNYQTLAAQWNQSGDQAWWLMIFPGGRLAFSWSEDGITPAASVLATEQPPIDPFGVVRVRARLVTDDGAGGWTVTFEVQTEPDGPWSQLGDVLSNNGGGTTSIHDSSAPYTVGAYLNAGFIVERFIGRIYSVEVREGTSGPVVVSPDFGGHLNGTTTFTDDQGNIWTIHSPASISSPETTVTVAMLGPLETGQCAEWVDYTLPRSGVGITCDHDPELCCSYYRSRTVGRIDGELRISGWSDQYDPGLPAGLIVMWPSTEASVPSGWDRVSSLDGRYVKSIPDAVTEPGSQGGAATHTHTVPPHTHDTSHIHTVTGNTNAATGTLNSANNTAGTTAISATHTHTRSSTNSATVASGSATAPVDTESNDVERLEVIFVESDGTPLGVPDGALGLSLDISMSGWADYAGATDRLFKGVIGATGGAMNGSALNSHQHVVGAHAHGGTSHFHTSSNTGSAVADKTLVAGAQAVLGQTMHSHSVAIGSTSTAALDSGGSVDSSTGAASMLPPYRNLRAQENISGAPDLPVGLICAWRGDIGAIPDFWQLCDGTNGTPDMFGRYPRGAVASIGATGGSLAAHAHTSPTHNHSTSGHAHTSAASSAATTTFSSSTTNVLSVATASHTHTMTNTNSTTPTVANTSAGVLNDSTTEAPYEEVAFVQLVEEPTPPPEPTLFCLDWDIDEHLIRTTGPAGPLWTGVKGKFEWDVDRPFTAASGVNGTRFVTSSPPGGRNLHMVAAVESEAELATLHAVLSRPLVLISPSDASEVWAAPVAETVRIVKIDRIRYVTADFIGTGPQPGPQLADVT